jgi:DUF971 family protein
MSDQLISVRNDMTSIRVEWQDKTASVISSSRLRSLCRCAWCTRGRLTDSAPKNFDDILINDVVNIGGYAINITFSDGHNRGIFPWSYLASENFRETEF